jgi:diguanylate cyclase (GGDEF)-like protein/PAS domain S-box-containing protein
MLLPIISSDTLPARTLPRRPFLHGRLAPLLIAGLMLAVSLSITYTLLERGRQDVRQNLHASFDSGVQDIAERIKRRMATYEQVMRGAQGFFGGAITVRRDDFRAYVATLRLEENYPGIQGIAIAQIVPLAQKERHVAALRAQGWPEYNIKPAGERPIFSSIIQIEPFSGANLRAFGFDMLTEPVRRAAMEQARDSGDAALSGRLTLVQEAGAKPQPGFVMYLPVYRRGMPTATVEQRRASILGWVGAPFRMYDLMAGQAGELPADLDVKIYDGDVISEKAKLYDASGPLGNSLFRTSKPISIAGHRWTLVVSTLPAFAARIDSDKPKYIAVTGISASLLLALLIWLLASGRARALAKATEMTDELRESEKWLNLALDSAQLGVVDWDIRNDVAVRSARHDQIYGYQTPQQEWNRQRFLDHLLPEDRAPIWQQIKSAWAIGRMDLAFRIVQPGGALRWVSLKGSVLHDGDGKPVRQIGTVADITELKLAEKALRKAHGELEIRVQQRTADLLKANQQLTREIEERRKVEADLVASRERLASIFDAVTEGLVVQSKDGRFMELNTAAEKILGLSAEQLAGSTSLEQFMPTVHEDGTPFPAATHPALVSLETGKPVHNVIMGLKKPDGRLTWISINTELLFDEQGSVNMVVSNFSDITAKKQSEEVIWHQANFDTLTGLPNRRLFQDHLKQEMRNCRRAGLPLALMFLDLDHFKDVNDTLGHETGDILLKEAAQRLISCVRERDTVARLGGDEFTIILGELHNLDHVPFVAQNILQKLAEPFQLGIETAYISSSIGITLYPDDADDIDTLLRNADQAMYAAKNQGRNRYNYFTESMQQATQARMWLANELRGALAGRQFRVMYQPIVELATGGIGKAEALIRWQHPTHGMISPGIFIPIAEETGLINEIGDWVFRQAANQVKRWRAKYHPAFQISINRSPVQFRSKGSGNGSWFDYLKQLGLPGQSIAVEITEGMLLDASTSVSNQLLAFRDAGIQVSLDDFGTGYSSLSYLQKFDIDNLKIDQSFVRNLAPGSGDLALCEAIIVMAHKLNLKVIAEGVETQLQRDLLTAVGCDYAQGYLFSKAVSAEEFECY